MAYAEKRGDKLTGRWIARARTKKGAFQHTFETKKEADGYELYVKLTGEEPPAITSGNTGRTFKEIADECKRAGGPKGLWKNGKDPSLFQRLDYAIARIGAVDIGDVTRKVVREKIVESLQDRPGNNGKPLSVATINRYVAAVSAVLTWAEDEEIIDRKPRLPFVQENNERQEVLTFEQETVILRVMRSEGYTLEADVIRFLVETGMRIGELYGRRTTGEPPLAPEQIGTDTVNLRGDQTKNHRPRSVYVEPELARTMRAMLAAETLPRRRHLLTVFKRAAKKCGHSNNLVLHSLRHTRNTRLQQAGVDIKQRMEMLGQKRVETNLRYTHIDAEAQREAAQKVDARRGQSGQDGAVVPFDPAKKVS